MHWMDKPLDTTLDKQFVFIVGAPRSGTTWLERMVASHPMVASIPHELTLFSKYFAGPTRFFARETLHRDRGDWEQGLPMLFTPEEFDHGLRRITEVVYSRVLAQRPTATHILDKHPHYARCLPLIDRVLPTSRIIHLIRDGRDVAVSTMSTKRRIGHGQADIEGASRVWYECITAAQAHGRVLGETRYLEVRYEELVADTTAQLLRIFHFCGLDHAGPLVADIAQANAIENRQFSRGESRSRSEVLRAKDSATRTLDLRQRYLMERSVGPLLMRLSYTRPGWWAVGPFDRGKMALWSAGQRWRRSAAAFWKTWKKPLVEHLDGAGSELSDPRS